MVYGLWLYNPTFMVKFAVFGRQVRAKYGTSVKLGKKILEELLEGFLGYMIGNMIAVFFVLCQILGKMQHGQIRYMQIINFSYFVW